MKSGFSAPAFFSATPGYQFLPNKSTKIIAILLVMLLPVVKGNAQYYDEQYTQMVAGLIGGVNFTQVDGDGYKGYNKVGVNAGGIIYLPFRNMDLPIEGTIALSMEVLYSQKGSRGNDPVGQYGINRQTINLHYAEVPFQINYFRGARKSGFGLGLGVGYLAFYEELLEQASGTVVRNGYPFNKIDFSFLMTGNIHIYNGFFVCPRFQYSLLSIRNNAGGFGRNEQFNNVFSLRLMYLIGSRSGY